MGDDPECLQRRSSTSWSNLSLFERLMSIPAAVMGILAWHAMRAFDCCPRRSRYLQEVLDDGEELNRRQTEHAEHMEYLSGALRGRRFDEHALRRVLTGFKGEVASQGMIRPELKAMFYFAEATEGGTLFLEFLEKSNPRLECNGGDDDTEIPYTDLI